MVERLQLYPAILVVTWTFAAINRIHNSVHPKNEIFALALLQGIFRSFQVCWKFYRIETMARHFASIL